MWMCCKACGGIYEDRSSDGGAYFHACPPLTRLTCVGAKGNYDVPLSGWNGKDAEVSRVMVERDDKRDENTIAAGPRAGDVKSSGAGVIKAETFEELDIAVEAVMLKG